MNHPLKLGGILFLITAICVGLLSTVNSVTAPIIKENERASEEKAMKALLKEAESFENVEVREEDTVKKVVLAKKEKEIIGYILRLEPNGYGGAIKLLIGLDTLGTVTGISILEHAETPGFGANADKDEFKNQFIDRQAPLKVSQAASKVDEIQAITGATITSKAITEAVNTAVSFVMVHQTEWGNP